MGPIQKDALHTAQALYGVLGASQGRAGDKQKLKQRQEGTVAGNCKTRYSEELWKSAIPEVNGGMAVPLTDAVWSLN